MKHVLTAIFVIALMPLAACSNSGAEKEVKGYAVYKFINLGSIDVKAFKANEADIKIIPGVNYDGWVEQQELFASRGFDLHTPLIIQSEAGEEIVVYLQTKDYKELWKVSPHDLAKQKKSHFVSIKYIQDRVGDERVNRAISLESKLIQRDPIIRK